MPASLPTELAARLAPLGRPERIRGAQAYLKTTDPFFGVDAPTLRAVLKDFYPAHAPRDAAHCRAQVAALWARPQREMKYAAIAWARRFKAHITLEALPLYERMIREGQWWDTVDAVAAHLVGRLLLEHRRELRPVMEQWISDENLWIRRAALLAHLTHRAATDEARLFDHCLRLAPEKDFFIRKAIGWALRAYSKVQPERVRAFLSEHRSRFSGLSTREGMKVLTRASP
ncbi:MAG TPA: DNA alkylation repair protein [Holophagaceae bacterium]|nr:DNA alkylation repair protein [Holophagaceae bacterium]